MGGETAKKIRERDSKRLKELCNEGEIITYWEHDIEEALQKDEEMAEFFDSIPDIGPINVHDAFFGGR